jgi:Ring finger domain
MKAVRSLSLLFALLVVASLGQEPRKAIFYNSSSFQMALKGESTVQGLNGSLYTFAKIDSEVSADGSNSSTIILTFTILKERYLMADRQTIVLTFKGSSADLLFAYDDPTRDPIVIKGKFSQMMDATMPVEFQECDFEYHHVFSDTTSHSFQLLGYGSCRFSGTFKMDSVPYRANYYFFIFFFVFFTLIQIYGFRRLISSAREEFETVMRKISIHGLLLDTTMNSCILYHFGVILPIDVKIVVPQILLMINSSFFWMQKLVHSIHNQPNQSCGRFFQFLCTMIMMIGGLYVPILDRKSYSLLVVGIFPLFFQVYNSFTNRVASFSFDYNILFKPFQFLIICYIYGWPLTSAHLLPTYPMVTVKYMIVFVIVTVISYLQKSIHPRFYIKTRSDYMRQLLMPIRVTKDEKIGEADEKRQECPICLADLHEATTDSALRTPCGHSFHEDCLKSWLLKNENCPICRAPVFSPDEWHYVE